MRACLGSPPVPQEQGARLLRQHVDAQCTPGAAKLLHAHSPGRGGAAAPRSRSCFLPLHAPGGRGFDEAVARVDPAMPGHAHAARRAGVCQPPSAGTHQATPREPPSPQQHRCAVATAAASQLRQRGAHLHLQVWGHGTGGVASIVTVHQFTGSKHTGRAFPNPRALHAANPGN